MSSEHKYEIIIYWSEEDSAFIAEVPELAGCTAEKNLGRGIGKRGFNYRGMDCYSHGTRSSHPGSEGTFVVCVGQAFGHADTLKTAFRHRNLQLIESFELLPPLPSWAD